MYRIYVSALLYLGVALFSLADGQTCSEDKVRKCISIAEPMLKDPRLIFPDNTNDIDAVCRTWSNFVDCIRRYIDKCFSKLRKDQFNTAVEPPIASVHQMCSVSSYQSEYLEYAGCIKATVIEPEHCGAHYSALVNEVSREQVRKANLCCAYRNFRSCVILKTRLRCDANQEEGIAARFSRQVLDKAFRFLQDQCLNYVETAKCPPTTSSAGSARSPQPSSQPASSPRPLNGRAGEARSVSLESASARGKVRAHDSLESGQYAPAMPTWKLEAGPSPTEEASTPQPLSPTSELRRVVDLDSAGAKATSAPSQRSSGYARGISWTSPPTWSSSTSDIPDWATSSWLTHAQQQLTTEEIYPAAGSFGGNNVDEPNQQGLSRGAAGQLAACSAPLLALLASCAAIPRN